MRRFNVNNDWNGAPHLNVVLADLKLDSAQKGIGKVITCADADGNAVWSSISKIYSQSSLALNGNNGNFFICSISANSSITLSNILSSQIYHIVVNNTGSSTITITLPNTADRKASPTITIAAGKAKQIAFIYDGTTRYWQDSVELS